MSEKKIEDIVYEDGIDLDFVADQVAAQDALQTFLIDCIRTAENFKGLQEKLTNGLTAVSITKAIDVDTWLKSHDKGYVALVKGPDISSVDYYRDDEGIPVIFRTMDDILPGIGSLTLVRVIDLAEEAASRADD